MTTTSGMGATSVPLDAPTKVVRVRLPGVADRATQEERYWRKFVRPIVDTHAAEITHVHCADSPDAPDWAVSTSTRVVVYSGRTGKPKRQLTRFSNLAYSGRLRGDGRLLVAGGESPTVQVFQLASRSVLRQFNGHSMAVHCTRWGATAAHVLSCSDDKSVRLWDITTGEGLATLHGHTDYVRCAESMLSTANAGLGGVGAASNSGNVWATGSYDHTVRLWDMRESDTHSERGRQVMSMDHGAPVEAVLPLTGGTLVLSAGENRVRVWDVMGGGRLIAEFSNHQKTVTALACDREGSRVLTGGLDGMIKVHDMKTFNNTASMRYGSPILSFGLTPGNRRLVVGLSTGELSVKSRSSVDEVNTNVGGKRGAAGVMNEKTLPLGAGAGIKRQSVAKPIYAGSMRYFARGHQIKTPSAGDLVPAHQKKQKMNAYDVHMKKFRYGAALDAALDSKQPETVASVLEDLVQRSALDGALSNRDEDSLEPLLAFLNRYITNPRFAPLLIDVCTELLTLYAPALGRSVVLDELFLKLSHQLKQELKLQHSLHQVQGTLDCLLCSSSMR